MQPDEMLAALRRHPIALSIRQPWCHHILHNGKDIENRSWSTPFRGPVLIHAGKRPKDAAYCREIGAPLGGIVGMVEITGCVTSSASEWFFGPYGFTLQDAAPLAFVPCNGRLGFFTPQIDPQDLRVLAGTDEALTPAHAAEPY